MRKNSKSLGRNIYFDYAGATPINEKVLKIINSNDIKLFANPGAIHGKGIESRKIVDISREKIATLLNAHADEIIFTGSGTESIALALIGVVNNYKLLFSNRNKIPHIITTNIEHPAVLENCKMLEDMNLAEVTYIQVNKDGIIDPKKIKSSLKENTILVSVMYTNNEIGTIQPIREIAKEIRHFKKNKSVSLQKYSSEMHGYFSAEKFLELTPSRSLGISKEIFFRDIFPVFHTDACQAMNYLDTNNMDRLGVDMLSFNGSKIYGPKGVGVLYKKRGVEISPIYKGGGQEFNLRSGTENVSSIAGIALALEITSNIKEKEFKRLTIMRDYAIKKLLELNNKTDYQIRLNGDLINRIPNNINISIKGIKSELIVIELDAFGICVSEKSACHSENGGVSHVLSAIRKASGESINEEEGSLRISLGRDTKKLDIDYLISSLEKILEKYKPFKAI